MITLSPSPTQSPPPSEILRVDHGADSDPRIANLKGMFPDFDDAVILSVLESVDNDQDHALDVLLGMNDPTYISSTLPAPPPTIQQQPLLSGPTQEELDEQFARRLALEEEQAARAWSTDRQPGWGPPPQQQQQAGYQTYQPRRGNGRGWGASSWGSWGGGQSQTTQPQGQNGQRDTMTEFQEGFNKIAECEVLVLWIIHSGAHFGSPLAGKKTFSIIVSRVKAKMHEFDQGGGFSSGSTVHSAPGPNNQAPGDSSAPDYAYSPPYGAGRTTNPSWSAGQPRTNTYVYSPVPAPSPVPPTYSQLGTRTRTPSPPAVRGYDVSDHTNDADPFDIPTSSPSFPEETTMAKSGGERDVGAARDSISTEQPASPATELPGAFPITSRVPASASSLFHRPSSGSGLGPVPVSGLVQRPVSPPASGPAPRSNVDFTKLGLLPKRPVSLVRPLSPPAAGAGNDTGIQTKKESDDELEYVENPFEDRH
ncbi:hypothetical protein J3A83DRAFT_4371020 [Scleroderma citrinum]